MNNIQILNEALNKNNLHISNEIQQKMILFVDLILKWNKVFNLTAIRDIDQAIWLHLVDSLIIQSYLHGKKIIDVGSGAGLPGIPLALLFPEKQFVLLDSNGKKTRFIQQAIIELGLKNVSVIQSRVENFLPEVSFDSIITRAFATLDVMLEQTNHLLAPKGQFLAMKGIYPAAEIAALPAEFKILAVHRLNISGVSAERHLVCIERSLAGEKNSSDS